jgi:flagellar motor switch/type III secretory pathway protein FliN
MAAPQTVTETGQAPASSSKAAGEIVGCGSGPATSVFEAAAAQALVPVTPIADAVGEEEFSGPVLRLPVELDVAVPVREFRVRHLLALAPQQVIESQWGHCSDLPLAAGDVLLAWSEFEVVETRLAVRVARLA